MDYFVAKYQHPNYNICRDMNYFLVTFGKVQTPDRQTESDAYEPTMQIAQMGSKNWVTAILNSKNRDSSSWSIHILPLFIWSIAPVSNSPFTFKCAFKMEVVLRRWLRGINEGNALGLMNDSLVSDSTSELHHAKTNILVDQPSTQNFNNTAKNMDFLSIISLFGS